jgi:hypothetical protein
VDDGFEIRNQELCDSVILFELCCEKFYLDHRDQQSKMEINKEIEKEHECK